VLIWIDLLEKWQADFVRFELRKRVQLTTEMGAKRPRWP